MKELWVNGSASENRDDWMEEVKANREGCYDDEDETSEVQAGNIQDQRRRGASLVAWSGHKVDVAVDRVLRARWEMMKNEANGSCDCLVTEMVQHQPVEAVYEVTHWFAKRFKERAEHQGLGGSYECFFSDARLENGLRGFRAIVLQSVLSKWFRAILVGLLHQEKESIEWRNLHVGAGRGVNCEHMQALLTYILQQHWEWQEDRRTNLEPGFFRCKTAFAASLCPQWHRRFFLDRLMGMVVALLAEMKDVTGSACFENCETTFRCSQCFRQRGVEAPVLWGRVAKKTRGWGLAAGRKHDNEYFFRGQMWADSDWLFSDDKEKLVCMVNDIIEELLDLDMRSKLESLWWTSTYKDQDGGEWRKALEHAHHGGIRCAGLPFLKRGKGWCDKYIYRAIKCAFDDKMQQGSQSCVQHRIQWQC